LAQARACRGDGLGLGALFLDRGRQAGLGAKGKGDEAKSKARHVSDFTHGNFPPMTAHTEVSKSECFRNVIDGQLGDLL
jgi:hypothetical protein